MITLFQHCPSAVEWINDTALHVKSIIYYRSLTTSNEGLHHLVVAIADKKWQS